MQDATFGERVRGVCTAGFTLIETRHEARLSLRRHAHARPTLTLLLEGSFTERMDGSSHEVGPQDVVYRPGELEHANEYGDGGARCFIVEIDEDELGVSGRTAMRLSRECGSATSFVRDAQGLRVFLQQASRGT